MIVFENNGKIDMRSISTFGVSVKEGDNPIGFFGTGLKYAIAVLLRANHKITIFSGDDVVKFGVLRDEVRGQEFEFVTMAVNDLEPVPIGFTTQLGKMWEVWMAYREIACNCKDEDGSGSYHHDMPSTENDKTKIIVKGDTFETVFANRHDYILEDTPFMVIGNIEVRNRHGSNFYYRGVRVMQFQDDGIYTYNDNQSMELTEDRTVKHQWEPRHNITVGILRATNKAFLRTVLTAKKNTLEGQLGYHGYGVKPSDEFLDVVSSLVGDKVSALNLTALKVWTESTNKKMSPREINITKMQKKSLEKAVEFCEKIGFQIHGSYPIKIVESLGEGVLGMAMDETIFIAERTFQIGGTKQVASTLIEEYLHLRHGWKDMSRELQSFLFEKLVSVGEELVGEPL